MARRMIVFAMVAVVTAAVIGAAVRPPVSQAAALPAQFSDELVAAIASPTALAFTPDGRLLIATQGGQLRVVANGTLLPTPALNLDARVCTNIERGLLGLAVHPNFGANRYIYVFYTFNKHNACPSYRPTAANNPVNRVSRFTLSASSTIDPASELVLLDNIHSPNGNHNAGDLHFGKDGWLYISVGDGGCDYAGNSGCAGANDAALERHTLLGKILRITDTGGIPSSNPYQGTGTARCNTSGSTSPSNRCQETLASGLRNPFRIAFDPNASGTRFFINDVGQGKWEEINQGAPGADYGWNVREGFCANDQTTNCRSTPNAVVGGLTDPVHAYGRSVGYSITGGAFVPNGIWPPEFNGDYLFGDYGGTILRVEANGAKNDSTYSFVTGLGGSSVVNMIFGPYGSTKALYYTTFAGGGQIRRISYVGAANRAPAASIAASPTSGATPLAVNFNGGGSSDPDGDALTYVWNFGDGSAARETSTPTTGYTYATSGTFTASLTVRDSNGASSTAATLRIDAGNTAPTATITAPADGALFTVGQTLTLSASASDTQDGTLPTSSLSWRVIQHHNDHTHPYLQPTSGNNLTITAPAPEDLQATETSYLELELTVTDSQGLTTVVRRNVQPRLVDVTFNSEPSGLRINANGFQLTTPVTIKSWQNYRLDVSAPVQTGSGGQSYEWVSWSDAGAQAHTIVTPGTASSYSATFRDVSGEPGANLLANPSFEQDATNDTRPDAWSTNGRVTRSSSVVRDGAYALRHRATDNGSYAIYQAIANLRPGQAYDLSAWVNIPATGDRFSFTIEVAWKDAGSNVLRTDTVKAYTAATGGWNRAAAALIAPGGTTQATVRHVVSSLNATIYADDWHFVRSTANALLNAGFELDGNGDGRPDGWSSTSSFTRSNAVARSGSYSGRHRATTNTSYSLYQLVTPVQAGAAYAVSGWVNIPATGDQFAFAIAVAWKNGSGTVLRTDTVHRYTAATSGWNLGDATLVAPVGASEATVRQVVESLNATVYIDDVVFRPQ